MNTLSGYYGLNTSKYKVLLLRVLGTISVIITPRHTCAARGQVTALVLEYI